MNSNKHAELWAVCCGLLLTMFAVVQAAESAAHPLDAYNVVWDTPSRDSAESMPCGGHDIGLNVWVENKDVMFYMQRSGSIAENNEYLKLGRIRLRLDPNPFVQRPRLSVSGEHMHPASQVIDGNPKTKWFVLGSKQAWILLDFDSTGFRADSYALTSAEDCPGRDPKNWTLSGSNDGKTWMILDQRQDEEFSGRNQTRRFTIAAPKTYPIYRINFDNDGDPDFQLAEIALFAGNEDIIKTAREMSLNTKASFRQELKLRQGFVEIQGGTTIEGQPLMATLKIWCETARPIIHVEMDANRDVSVDAAYENWRLEDENLAKNNRRRRSCFMFDQYPGMITLSRDIIQFADQSVLFYHRNPNNDQVPGILLAQQGLKTSADEISDDIDGRTFGGMLVGENFISAGETTGQYQVSPYKAWHLKSQKLSQKHHLRIITHIDQTDTVARWQSDLQTQVNASAGNLEASRTDTQAWWAAFWDRSWICINPDRPDPSSKAWRAARNYNLFRYQLGCNASGEYPTKFNGGNLTVDTVLIDGNSFSPDWRDWGGGVFTAQNQRLVYWPMLKSGDFDAILPQFELYRKALGGARARVKKHFGHDGAVYSEYIGVPGIAIGNGWGWENGGRKRGTEVPFGDPRANADRGYNDLVEAGVMANPSISYHWESQLEHAYMIMEYHRFTGMDISPYMPFIENSVLFFDEHYRMREKIRSGKELNSKGKLVIYPSTSCETYRGATNPVDIVSGLRACLEGILQLNDSLLGLRDKAYYRTVLSTIPDYPFGEIDGYPVMKPAESYLSIKNVECPQFYPLFPFNRFDLQGKENNLMQMFRNTWQYDRTIAKGMVQSWHQDGIFFARMGMTKEAAEYNLKKLDDSPRRYPTFWGPGHDWVPDHNWGGSGMIGLQEMLMQTMGEKIYLLPAWPKEWDVDFKLHAPYKTIIEGTVKNGKVESLKVSPQSRFKDVQICTK